MKKLKTIYNNIIKIKNNPKSILNIYNENKTFLDNLTDIKNIKDFDDYITVLGFYFCSIYDNGNYSLTIEICTKVIKLFEEYNLKAKFKFENEYWYKEALFYKGISEYYLRDYRKSYKTFKYLIGLENNNDRYKAWFYSIKDLIISKIINILSLICLIIIILNLFLSYTYHIKILSIISNISLIVMIALFSYEVFKKKKIKRIKEK